MSPAGTGDGGSGRTPSVDDTTDAPYHLDWQGDAPGTVVTATITGGAYEGDTADLDGVVALLAGLTTRMDAAMASVGAVNDGTMASFSAVNDAAGQCTVIP